MNLDGRRGVFQQPASHGLVSCSVMWLLSKGRAKDEPEEPVATKVKKENIKAKLNKYFPKVAG